MRSLASSKVEQVLSLIHSGHNAHQISAATGHHTYTITWIWSKHCPDVPKPHGGHPTKLSDTDIHHACCLINSGKAENSTQVTKLLQTITNKTLSPETVHMKLKKAGYKAVGKKKRPMLSRHHRQQRMDFAVSHKEWTLEDRRTSVWSEDTKVDHL